MKDLRAERRKPPDLPPPFDRRRRERIELAIPLRILSRGLIGEKADNGTCTDLSEGGVSFDCAGELNVGEVVVLEFRQKAEPRTDATRVSPIVWAGGTELTF